MDAGRRDAEVHVLLAQVRLSLGEIAAAVEAVRTARALVRERPNRELSELHEFLTTRFGKVLIIGGGTEGAHLPEPIHVILDPELKRLLRIALERFDDLGGSGSTSLYLPVGSYRVGTHIVSVGARKTVRMDVRASVGSAGGGVYGEFTDPERPPGGAGAARAGAVLRFGGLGFLQQGTAGGGGRVLVGLEGDLGAPGPGLGLRVAADVGFHRVERVDSRAGAAGAFGVLPGASLAIGPVIVLPGDRASLLPWLSLALGYAAPIPDTLPQDYSGPRAYFTYGGDVELRVRFHLEGGSVHPEISARFLYRETQPLGAVSDPRPHSSVGAGLGFGFWISP
jgi:hypothetical protein